MGNRAMEESFVIANKVEELAGLASKIEGLAEKWGIPVPVSMNINLVLEEAISNIIFYAFNDSARHDIKVTLSLAGDNLVLKIEDDGIPFDPTSAKKPDISLPAEDRPIGGLGIFLISKIMDNVSYKREKDKNILLMKKKI